MLLTEEESRFFRGCVRELLQNRDVRSMSSFVQHGNVSTLEHCVSVAYISFEIGKRLPLRVDFRSLIRGAVLHDFFLYDWHVGSGRKELHAFAHPRTALRNAEARFRLNDCERDVILRHMWPLTPAPPRCPEAWIVGAADKYCSLIETLSKRPAVALRPFL